MAEKQKSSSLSPIVETESDALAMENAHLAAENAELRALLETATTTSTAPVARPFSVMFRAPAKLTKADVIAAHAAKKAITIANADVSGPFVGTRYDGIVVKDFALSSNFDGTIAVYMPASGPRAWYKHVGPRMIVPPAGTIAVDAAGNELSHIPDPAGRAAQKRLEDDIRNAWANANAACSADHSNPYDRDWPLAV